MDTKSALTHLVCLACAVALLCAYGAFPANADVAKASQIAFDLDDVADLLDPGFYTGTTGGRAAFWGSLNNAGTTVAFGAIDFTDESLGFYLVDLGDPSSWRPLATGFEGIIPGVLINWTADDSALILDNLRIDVAKGNATYLTGVYGNYSFVAADPALTTAKKDNWIVIHDQDNRMIAIPVHTDGTPDTNRSAVTIADFSASGGLVGYIDWPAVAPDATSVAFADYNGSNTPGVPDHGDIYVLTKLKEILAGKRPAPTSLSDPIVKPIRVGESENLTQSPGITQDGKHVIYCEDFYNKFRFTDYFDTLSTAAFDAMISNSNGRGQDYRIFGAGNQVSPIPTRGGTRIVYARPIGDSTSQHAFIASLIARTRMKGVPPSNKASEDIVTGSKQTAEDASGTTLNVAAGTLIDFPAGASPKIAIQTPVAPVASAALPPGIDRMPVVRTFSPTNTLFTPSVTATIAYTEGEVNGLIEGQLRVYRYDPNSGKFDDPVTITSRSQGKNTITFTVDRLGTYGVGGAAQH